MCESDVDSRARRAQLALCVTVAVECHLSICVDARRDGSKRSDAADARSARVDGVPCIDMYLNMFCINELINRLTKTRDVSVD